MAKGNIIVEGVLKSLEGLKMVMGTTEDTGENAELEMKIEAAIEVARWMTADGLTEEQWTRQQRELKKALAAPLGGGEQYGK